MPKPTDFPAADPLTGAEVLPIIQGGVDSRTTPAEVIEALGVSPQQMAEPKSLNGVGFRPNLPTYDAWMAKLIAKRETPTPSTPLRVVVFGSSISSISRPAAPGGSATLAGYKPWPLYVDGLNLAADAGWKHAGGDAETINMDTTNGAAAVEATGGWGIVLDSGEFVQQAVTARYLSIVWTRQPSGGLIEVRSFQGSFSLLATIDTSGTLKSGCTTDLELVPNLGPYRADTIFFSNPGAPVSRLDGVVVRGYESQVQVVNAAHSGYSCQTYLDEPSRGLDYVEMSDPDCVIIMLGANDTIVNFDVDLRALVAQVQARTDNLIMIVGEPRTVFNEGFTNAMSLIAREVASDLGCVFVDVNQAFPSFDYFYSSDGLHPSQPGHRAIAAVVGGVLFGDPIGYAYNFAARASNYTPATAARWPVSMMTTNLALDHLSTTTSPAPSITAIPAATSVTTGDGKAYWRVPSGLNGRNLVGCAIAVNTTSSSGLPTVQLARGRQAAPGSAHTYADMLSTRMTIDVGEYDSRTAAAAAVINAANDDVATGDLIRIDVDTAGTGTAGLHVTLEFA
jgi:lysophospholipase L1-like esterase